MNEEEFANYRKDLAVAFQDRKPNTNCLEIVRLLMRLPDDFRKEYGEEWRRAANPETFWSKTDDIEFNTARTYMYLHFLLMDGLGFEPEEQELPITEILQDQAFELGFKIEPNGMD